MQTNVVALIPARRGSKKLQNKNFSDLCGHPLIYYSIQSAKKSNCIEKIIVTTDSLQIGKYCKDNGCEVIQRPDAYSQDLSPMIDCVRHALEELKRANSIPEYVVLLQPTSPLREDGTIDRCMELFVQSSADSLMGVSEMSPKGIRVEEDRIHFEYSVGKQRQELDRRYYDQGHIYITRSKNIFEKGSLLGKEVIPFLVDKIYGLDIDSAIDLELAELYLENYKHRFKEILS